MAMFRCDPLLYGPRAATVREQQPNRIVRGNQDCTVSIITALTELQPVPTARYSQRTNPTRMG